MNGDEPEKHVTEPVQRPDDAPAAGPAPQNQPTAEPTTPWEYKTGTPFSPPPAEDSFQAAAVPGLPADVNWTASEFIAHSKGLGWYLGLAVFTIVLDVLLFLWTHDVLTVVVLPVFAVLFGIIAARKPRVMEYRLDAKGLFIGERLYPFADFKSFSIQDDGAFSSIMFLPIKRFMPPVAIYYEPKDEERVLQVLAQYLPMEHRTHDLTDRLARRIRF